MAKNVPDAELDKLLDGIALADELYVCTAEPANYAGIAAVALNAAFALTPGNGGGDFTIANGDTNGRKVTVSAQSSISANASGTANHVVLATGGVTDLIRLITTCPGQSVTSGNTMNTAAFDDEVADAA